MDEILGALIMVLAWIVRMVWHVVFETVAKLLFQALLWLVAWPWRRRQDGAA